MADWTGERFILGHGSPEVHHEHLHRYELAALFADGRDILDLGCGTGSGSAILSSHGGTVTAIDIDPGAVEHARRHVGDRVTFLTGSAVALPFADAQFDLVTCFEVIEHVAEQAEVLAQAARVLRGSGILIMSTPMRGEYNKGLLRPNPFHVREMEHDEFDALLGGQFAHRQYIRQRSVIASVMWQQDGTSLLHIAEPPGAPAIRKMEPVYEVAVCSREPLPAMPGASLYLDLAAQGDVEPSLVTQVRDAGIELTDAGIELTDADRRARELAKHLTRLDEQIEHLQAASENEQPPEPS